MISPLATELNDVIERENPHVYRALSHLGKALYFPKGILAQSAEAGAKAKKYNATIGIATEKGRPMHLGVIQETLSPYDPKDLYPYAPPTGKPELRAVWREKILRDNPSLEGKSFGLPIVTNALTHGLSIVADLFADENDALVIPDKQWENYDLTFTVRRGVREVTFPLYTSENRFNVAGLRDALLSEKDSGKALLLLNFPNNPTGFTPSTADAEGIVLAIREAADAGITVVVICDDAYFGLFFEDSLIESLFAKLAGSHPRIIPIKVDGATKEDFVWGFRVGFVTYAGETPELLKALEQKTMAAIRSTISSASHPSQTFILRALTSPEVEAQRREKFLTLKSRANRVKRVLDSGKYKDAWTYYPFNSGYFMCLKLYDGNADAVRMRLLDHYQVGTIALGPTDLRIAFSCLEEENVEDLFTCIHQAVLDLRQA